MSLDRLRSVQLRVAKMARGKVVENPSVLDTPAELSLAETVELVSAIYDDAERATDYATALYCLRVLGPAVDYFFEHTLVNDERADVQARRIQLLQRVDALFLRFADFTLLQRD